MREPIRAVDIDVGSNGVAVRLNKQPSSNWIDIYRNLSGISFYMGMDYRGFTIRNARVEIEAHDDRYYQELITQIKSAIEATNREYARVAEATARRAAELERERLRQEAEAERRRMALRQQLRL